MKIFLKIILILVLLLVIAAVAGLLYFNSAYPVKIDAENISIEATPERLVRGEYLANHVCGCIDCHSDRDFRYYAGPIVEGTQGKGGFQFNQKLGDVPGRIYARNITPAGIGHYSDGEVLKILTSGINPAGEALFPLMPYNNFRHMSREDLYSVIAYIRTLKPIENKMPAQDLDFPLNFIVKTIPSPAELNASIPDKANTLAYGKYMTTAAGCEHCHSKMVKGEIVPGMNFAGGFQFIFPNGDVIHSANITPDNETGIGTWSKESFIAKFKAFVDSNNHEMFIPVEAHQKNTPMPWTRFGGMTEEDLGAIYTYLHSLTPVKNKITTFVAANGTM